MQEARILLHIEPMLRCSLLPALILASLINVPGCGGDIGDSSGSADANGDYVDADGVDFGANPPIYSLDDARMSAMLDAHNAVRRDALPVPDPALPELVWTAQLALDAARWANQCIMAHDPATGDLEQGENWSAWSAAYDLTAQDVVDGWASEVADYHYQDNSCDAVCGHYTQIVWRNTLELGCAVQTCPEGLTNWDGGRELWICRYAIPGNWYGEWPY